MSKYIDSEKLIAEVKFAKSVYSNPYRVIHGIADGFRQDGRAAMCDDILTKIASLQQEQPDVQNGKFVFPKYLYARSKDNKTIDMSYAPQDMTAVEYIRNDSIEQEQPEVDLEKEIKNYLATKCAGDDEPSVSEIARHFYGLRNRALEEAARHVYESWSGGTMDDVRRDMVELGKVLNARKEK